MSFLDSACQKTSGGTLSQQIFSKNFEFPPKVTDTRKCYQLHFQFIQNLLLVFEKFQQIHIGEAICQVLYILKFMIVGQRLLVVTSGHPGS